MDFSFRSETTFKTPGVKLFVLAALVLILPWVSGCAGQKARVDEQALTLATDAHVDARRAQEDFAFPSKPPSLARGKEVFQQNCMQCHAASFWQAPKVKADLAYSTPIDAYLMLTTGESPKEMMPTPERRQVLPSQHKAFKEQINRDDRWAVIFYTRYLAGAGDIKSPSGGGREAMHSEVFGGNCAVCHGNNGRADGPLFTAKTGNHELKDGPQLRNFQPAPADFRQYDRMYNRTDAQIFKYICQGVYPSAMPSWFGNVERDVESGNVVFVFDEPLIMNLVRHVRSLAYTNDLPEGEPIPAGLQTLKGCAPLPNNQPWTPAMRERSPYKGGVSFPSDPVTGGMILKNSRQSSTTQSHPESRSGQ